MVRFAAVLATLLFANAVHAQGYAPPPTPYPEGIRPFPVILVGAPDELRFTLSTERDGKPFVRCIGRCALLLPTGGYWISVMSTRNSVSGKEAFDIEEPSVVRVKAMPRDRISVASIFGLSLLGGGLALLGYGLVAKNESDEGERDRVFLGCASLGAGVGLTLAGGVADTRTTPDVSVQPMR